MGTENERKQSLSKHPIRHPLASALHLPLLRKPIKAHRLPATALRSSVDESNGRCRKAQTQPVPLTGNADLKDDGSLANASKPLSAQMSLTSSDPPGSPELKSILKRSQSVMSESGTEFPDSDYASASPSPSQDFFHEFRSADDVFSDSSDERKRVSFSEKVQRNTYRPGTCILQQKQKALKKREKRQKRDGRRTASESDATEMSDISDRFEAISFQDREAELGREIDPGYVLEELVEVDEEQTREEATANATKKRRHRKNKKARAKRTVSPDDGCQSSIAHGPSVNLREQRTLLRELFKPESAADFFKPATAVNSKGNCARITPECSLYCGSEAGTLCEANNCCFEESADGWFRCFHPNSVKPTPECQALINEPACPDCPSCPLKPTTLPPTPVPTPAPTAPPTTPAPTTLSQPPPRPPPLRPRPRPHRLRHRRAVHRSLSSVQHRYLAGQNIVGWLSRGASGSYGSSLATATVNFNGIYSGVGGSSTCQRPGQMWTHNLNQYIGRPGVQSLDDIGVFIARNDKGRVQFSRFIDCNCSPLASFGCSGDIADFGMVHFVTNRPPGYFNG
ncbi:hypothetical protein BV898_16336 [Hypsibius exemplaris]|uniref:Uncharacterized protein n=1 Tax=Hypsibius exemplaris TaxID=2072580 RepID=A0A9X6RL61_HYPEX|nr:hypothetical protein BV898_16336 [Hypsibius exemplaris]